jgi:hypothetical protein
MKKIIASLLISILSTFVLFTDIAESNVIKENLIPEKNILNIEKLPKSNFVIEDDIM